MRQVYPLTDVGTGKTSYAVWEGTPSAKNPQRLLNPTMLRVFQTRPEAVFFAASKRETE